MDYIIRNYDAATGSILVEFTGYGTWNIDLPIVDGKHPEGADLESYIQGFAPVHIAERDTAIKTGISNASVIQALVQPYPAQPTQATQPMSNPDAELQTKIEAIVTQVLQNSKVI